MKRLIYALIIASLAGPAAAVGRLADLTVYDRAEHRELPVYWHAGRAYVVGKPGNEYQVTVRNQLGQDVLAVISVDGVNVVSGQTASPAQSGYVLDAWRELDVKGWRKSLNRTAAFYFTSLPDSYAARTGRPDDVGVIGIALFRRKPEPPPVYFDWHSQRRRNEAEGRAYPAPAPEAPSGAQAPAASQAPSDSQAAPAEKSLGAARDFSSGARAKREERLGTGHGRSERSDARHVTFERATDHPEEVITLYYDSYQNLVRRGIIAAAAPEPREPRPFPSRFAPDPPRW
jgi:hypothetical protein